jgi:energy-coupling factor transport system ATP-binding protein
MDPDVLVLDEPTTGQDHKGRRKVAEVIGQLNRHGKTVIIITHDMRFVVETALRTVVLSEGRILADGPTQSIMTDVELLSQAAIKPPQPVQLGRRLEEYGYKFNMLTISDAFEEIGKILGCKRGG